MFGSRKREVTFICMAAIVVMGADPAGCHDRMTSDNRGAINLSFDRLKGLAGDWESAVTKDGAQKGKVHVRYHLTAGGSSVVETVFPGEEMEMITVYHRDHDKLMLTHYCHLGNQPRMRAPAIDGRGDLVFDFVDGTNLDAATETHMHGLRMRFVDADHIHTEWQLYRDGKATEKYEFDLVRKK